MHLTMSRMKTDEIHLSTLSPPHCQQAKPTSNAPLVPICLDQVQPPLRSQPFSLQNTLNVIEHGLLRRW